MLPKARFYSATPLLTIAGAHSHQPSSFESTTSGSKARRTHIHGMCLQPHHLSTLHVDHGCPGHNVPIDMCFRRPMRRGLAPSLANYTQEDRPTRRCMLAARISLFEVILTSRSLNLISYQSSTSTLSKFFGSIVVYPPPSFSNALWSPNAQQPRCSPMREMRLGILLKTRS